MTLLTYQKYVYILTQNYRQDFFNKIILLY